MSLRITLLLAPLSLKDVSGDCPRRRRRFAFIVGNEAGVAELFFRHLKNFVRQVVGTRSATVGGKEDGESPAHLLVHQSTEPVARLRRTVLSHCFRQP